MTRSVTFNGITMFRPGGLTRVNANALNQIGLATNGIIGVIGEADGGSNDITIIDDPALAKEKYFSGPIANALKPLFNPSGDPRVPGGAFRAVCVKVNNGTQATLTLYHVEKSDTAAAGSSTTLINLTTGGLTTDEMKGNLLRIGGVTRAITANAAGTVTVSPAFSSAPATGTTVEIMSPQLVVTSVDYGAHTNGIQFEYEPGALTGQSWTTTYNKKSQISDDFGGKPILQVEYTGQSTQVIRDTGTGDVTSTTTSIVDLTKAWTVDAFMNLMVEVNSTPKALRKISTNSATALTVAALGGSPSGQTFKILSGKVWSGTLDADAVASNTMTLEAGINLAANELQNMVVVITGGAGVGQKRQISANTGGVSSVLTLSKDWITKPETGDTYEIRYVTSATGTMLGSTSQATGFKTMLAKDGGTAAQDLNLTFTAGLTLQGLVDLINAQAGYAAYVGDGINGQTTLAKDFDYDAGATAVDLLTDRSAVTTAPNPTQSPVATWNNTFRQDLKAAVTAVNSFSNVITASRATGTGTGAGSGRPEFFGGVITVVGDSYKYLSGGTRGTSSNSAWQTGFDKLLTMRCNSVVVLADRDGADEGLGSTFTLDSVAAQLVSHLSVANGIGKSERGGYMGVKKTKTAYTAMANKINNPDIQLSAQWHQLLDVDGNLVQFPYWSSAVLAAGMRAGMPEVGEPLTHKYIGTFGMGQDPSWDPKDRTDGNILIQAGCLFAETITGKGTRWVRDITTWVNDDNMAYMEGSVRDAVRYVSYGHRTLLEDRFTGVKATPTNAQGIKDTGCEYLEQCRGQNIIVDSTDPRTGAFVKAYHNYRVTISGDIATIRVEIFPCVGINFQLNDIYLQLPSQAA